MDHHHLFSSLVFSFLVFSRSRQAVESQLECREEKRWRRVGTAGEDSMGQSVSSAQCTVHKRTGTVHWHGKNKN